MKLILNGGGSGTKTRESFELFKSLVGDKKVIYIPFAWTKGGYDGCLKWFTKEAATYGITNIDMVADANELTAKRLKGIGGIFIGGGNTFKLLKTLKESCAFNNIVDYLNQNDGVIMGGSAGALIFGSSIYPCAKDKYNLACTDVNEVGLKDLSGFDIAKGYSLFVHYKKLFVQHIPTSLRVKSLLKANYNLICLPENTSLYINDNEYSVVGGGELTTFTKASGGKIIKTSYKPNDKVNLQIGTKN